MTNVHVKVLNGGTNRRMYLPYRPCMPSQNARVSLGQHTGAAAAVCPINDLKVVGKRLASPNISDTPINWVYLYRIYEINDIIKCAGNGGCSQPIRGYWETYWQLVWGDVDNLGRSVESICSQNSITCLCHNLIVYTFHNITSVNKLSKGNLFS